MGFKYGVSSWKVRRAGLEDRLEGAKRALAGGRPDGPGKPEPPENEETTPEPPPETGALPPELQRALTGSRRRSSRRR